MNSRRVPGSVSHRATQAVSDMAAQSGSRREREVFALLADGLSNAQIARTFYISENTASVHVSNILRKLGITSRVHAALTAGRLDGQL